MSGNKNILKLLLADLADLVRQGLQISVDRYNETMQYPLPIRNTAPFNVLGLPAISIPCGFTPSGLLIGLQIAGAPFEETTVLALAHTYEQATEWHRRIPPV